MKIDGDSATGSLASKSLPLIGAAIDKIKSNVETSLAAPTEHKRRARGAGSEQLQSRAAEFRSQASDLREQAASETGHRAENLNARADRADAAADRLESAAGRSSATSASEVDVDEAPAGDAPEDSTASSTPSSRKSAATTQTLEQPTLAQAKSIAPQDEDDTATDSDVTGPARVSTSPVSNGISEVAKTSGDSVSLKASAGKATGDWEARKVEGQDVMLWNSSQSNYGKPQANQSISFNITVPESGAYTINLNSARVRSVMSPHERHEKDRGNDVFVKISDLDTGETILQPRKLFTYFGHTDETMKIGNQFSEGHSVSRAMVGLKSGTNYRLEVIGRSDGYALGDVSLERTK